MMRCYLVAGRNRLEAAIQLKWETIDAIELPDLDSGDDAAAMGKLAEIAENLHRREIDDIERGELVAAWVEARKGRHAAAEVSRQPAAKPMGRPSGGIRKAVRDLGMPERNVRRSLAVAALAPEAKAAARNHGLTDDER
jgi:ParB-like chromosome segregation protein Spo0J